MHAFKFENTCTYLEESNPADVGPLCSPPTVAEQHTVEVNEVVLIRNLADLNAALGMVLMDVHT